MLKENYYEYSLNFHSEQICAATKLSMAEARSLLIQGVYLLDMDMEAVTVKVISVELSHQV